MKLNIAQPDEIIVPAQIFDTTLNLEQIATVILVLGVMRGKIPGGHPRILCDETQRVTKTIAPLGVFSSKRVGDQIEVVIDLKKVQV
jgi:hypothetical protein